MAVDGPTNESKGDGGAATWLPPNKAFRCTYIEIQVSVKAKHGLWVTQAEHDAMASILSGCSGGSQVAASTPALVVPVATPVPAAQPTSQVVSPSGSFKPGKAYNCSDFATYAQAKAYFDSVPGDPSHLDADHDGIPCESLPGAP